VDRVEIKEETLRRQREKGELLYDRPLTAARTIRINSIGSAGEVNGGGNVDKRFPCTLRYTMGAKNPCPRALACHAECGGKNPRSVGCRSDVHLSGRQPAQFG